MTNELFKVDTPVGSESASAAHEAVNQSMADYRRRVLSRIQEAQGMSEGAVLDVGRSVNTIVDETREYITYLKESLGTLDDEHDEQNITAAIGRQSDAVEAFMRDMSEHLRKQEEKAQEAVEQSVRIIEAANTIKSMAYTAKILTLNAHIEAARLGQHGRAFQVIVKEMLKFSEVVEETNLKVSGLAEELQELLPEIAHQTRSIRHESEIFSNELETLNASVEHSSQALKDMVIQTVTEGDGRLKRVLDLSMEALSGLQFQDPMIQEIQRIDTFLHELHNEVGDALGVTFDPDPPVYLSRLGDALEDEDVTDDEFEGDFLMF